MGTELIHEDKSVGRITSLVESFREGCQLGLGYVKRSFKEPGTEIGSAIVRD